MAELALPLTLLALASAAPQQPVYDNRLSYASLGTPIVLGRQTYNGGSSNYGGSASNYGSGASNYGSSASNYGGAQVIRPAGQFSSGYNSVSAPVTHQRLVSRPSYSAAPVTSQHRTTATGGSRAYSQPFTRSNHISAPVTSQRMVSSGSHHVVPAMTSRPPVMSQRLVSSHGPAPVTSQRLVNSGSSHRSAPVMSQRLVSRPSHGSAPVTSQRLVSGGTGGFHSRGSAPVTSTQPPTRVSSLPGKFSGSPSSSGSFSNSLGGSGSFSNSAGGSGSFASSPRSSGGFSNSLSSNSFPSAHKPVTGGAFSGSGGPPPSFLTTPPPPPSSSGLPRVATPTTTSSPLPARRNSVGSGGGPPMSIADPLPARTNSVGSGGGPPMSLADPLPVSAEPQTELPILSADIVPIIDFGSPQPIGGIDSSRSPQPIGGIDLESLARMTEGEPLTAEQAQILFESEQIHLLLGGDLGTAPRDVSGFRHEADKSPIQSSSFDKILNGLIGSGSIPPISLPAQSLPPGLFPSSPEFAGRPVSFSR